MKTGLQTIRPRVHPRLPWLCAVAAASTLHAGDWPQYRGPNHDGISTETLRTNWSEEAPRQVWKIPLDPALSSFSVSGGKAFTQARRSINGQPREFCLALNADTGAEVWATLLSDDAAVYDGGVGSDDGPRSTPSVDGNFVYVLTSFLKLLCLGADDGHVVWRRDLVAEYGSKMIGWQSAASPLIEGDLILVICSATDKCLLAFHKADGREAWKGQNDVMTQASPVAATIAGVRQVVFFAQSGLVSVVPETGSVLWRYPFSYSTSTAASPVVGDDVVYCSAAYGSGAGAVRIAGSGPQLTTNQLWRTPGDNQNHWATPIYFNGYLYGMYGQSLLTLECIDLNTGSSQWAQGGFGYGSVLLAKDVILATSEPGFVVLVKPNPAAYEEVARFRALDGSRSSIPGLPVKCWNVPAISNGRLYVRSTTEAVCLDVAVAAPPPLKLTSALASGAGTFRLFIGTEDGSPLDTNRVANIDVFGSTDLTVGPGGWIKLTSPAALTNGRLFLDDPQSAATPQRFFHVEERP
ncbi:MAG TPA: PQQ-binding-like beta-propeller repeat protein [Haliangiales bacterium]|nr:PQQ-binding-like beta-propeller repeat protein [Haliangiales bacterium]